MPGFDLAANGAIRISSGMLVKVAVGRRHHPPVPHPRAVP